VRIICLFFGHKWQYSRKVTISDTCGCSDIMWECPRCGAFQFTAHFRNGSCPEHNFAAELEPKRL